MTTEAVAEVVGMSGCVGTFECAMLVLHMLWGASKLELVLDLDLTPSSLLLMQHYACMHEILSAVATQLALLSTSMLMACSMSAIGT